MKKLYFYSITRGLNNTDFFIFLFILLFHHVFYIIFIIFILNSFFILFKYFVFVLILNKSNQIFL